MFSFYFPDVNVNKNVLVTVKYVVKPLSKETNYDEASFRDYYRVESGDGQLQSELLDR